MEIYKLIFGTGNVKNGLCKLKPSGGLLAFLTSIFHFFMTNINT